MIFVDTSAWIEWLKGSPTGDKLAPPKPDTMARADDGAVGPCEMANQVAAGTQVCQVVSLDTEITPATGEACRDYGLAPADAIIVATSRAQAATLLTCDKHLKAMLGLTLITNAKT